MVSMPNVPPAHQADLIGLYCAPGLITCGQKMPSTGLLRPLPLLLQQADIRTMCSLALSWQLRASSADLHKAASHAALVTTHAEMDRDNIASQLSMLRAQCSGEYTWGFCEHGVLGCLNQVQCGQKPTALHSLRDALTIAHSLASSDTAHEHRRAERHQHASCHLASQSRTPNMDGCNALKRMPLSTL